ncbi:MAG TPA: PAS domain S-box protein [Thermoanaerobaculia bacterium]|nr:PAS domain S-box protein [Thermoanaerobaculia bacterium]
MKAAADKRPAAAIVEKKGPSRKGASRGYIGPGKAERATGNVERLYRDLVETSNDLIWAVDGDGRITFMSPACRKIYGREPEEMIGRLFLDFVPPDQYEKDLLAFTEAMTSGKEAVDYISRVYRKDGSIVTLSATGRIVYDEEGRAIGAHGISRDLTECLRAQEAQEKVGRELRRLATQLETERARLVAAQAEARVGSWEIDLATRTVICSAETYRIFEAGPDQWSRVYDGVFPSVHPDDREKVGKAFVESVALRAPSTLEYRLSMLDGRIKFIERRWQILCDEHAQPVRAVGTSQDITDRKQAELRLERLGRISAVLSDINQMIVREKDPQRILAACCRIAVEKGQFRMAWIGLVEDGGSVRVSAHAGASATGLRVRDVWLGDEERPGEYAIIRLAIKAGEHGVCNDIVLDPGAASLRAAALEDEYRSMASFPLKVGEQVIGTFNLYAGESGFFDVGEMGLLDELATDIAFALEIHDRDSERRRLEEALRQDEARLRESMRQLHEVSARLNLSREQERARMAREIHDHLGQALTALKMDVSEVRRRLRAADIPGVEERLTEMSALIDTSVDEVQRVAVELRPVLLDDLGLLDAIRAYLQEVERRAGLRCVLTTEVSDLPMADDRATALFRILQEALTNAVRHATARRVDVSLTADTDIVQLTVRDDGSGIPPMVQWDPKALGLVGMRDRALLFGGDVKVTGSPGMGTTVIARLPLRPDTDLTGL